MVRSARRRAVLAVVVAALVPACRDKASDGRASGGVTVAMPSSTSAVATDGEGAPDAPYEAGARSREAEPKVAIDRDGPVDPACAGPEISFNTAVVDARCAIGSARAKQLRAALERDDAGALPLRQEAKALTGARVALRLVNTGRAPITLPLSFSAKLPAFTVIAEDDRHTLYELEAPLFDVGAGADGDRPHFARIVLAPGGAALATLTVQTGVARVLGSRSRSRSRRAGDASVPSRLGKGRYVLHVGELLTDVEGGEPARVVWELP